MILRKDMRMTLTQVFAFILFSIIEPCLNALESSENSVLLLRQPKNTAVDQKSQLKDVRMTTPELIRDQGYPAEVHHVTTKDGYILELHRIPYGVMGRGRNPAGGRGLRPVVYLQHCLLCSSADWIMNTPDKALAYILADAGYDVWMGNVRGNTYSRRHRVLNPDKDPLFWEFSWNEMGKYDAPSSIDYVLNTTQQQKLYYVGFSMGTTIFFTMMDHHPEYSDKVIGMVALAPVAFTTHIRGPLGSLIPYSSYLYSMLTMAGVYELLPGGRALDILLSSFCSSSNMMLAPMCHNALFAFTGDGMDHLNHDFLPIILSHTPAGASLKTLMHYMQNGRADKFREFDYGFLENYRRYGQSTPRSYNLSRAAVPVAAFYAESDWLAPPVDVKRTLSYLPKVVLKHKVPAKNFTHLDFVWARDAVTLVYKPLLKILALFKSQAT